MGVAVADRTETTDLDQEREHAVRAALVAIEASAERLSTHRGRLTAEQLDDLTRSLAQDVRRSAVAERLRGGRRIRPR